MNESIQENGESKSTLTEMAAAIGIGDGEENAAGPATGDMVVNSMTSAKNDKRNTGNARKTPEPLPVSDALSVFQEAARMLQEAGLPVSAVQLPVSDGRPPRVAVLLDGVLYDTGKFTIASTEEL